MQQVKQNPCAGSGGSTSGPKRIPTKQFQTSQSDPGSKKARGKSLKKRHSIVGLKDVNLDREPRLQTKEDIRDRMDAVGQMSLIGALMAGAAISSLTVELPEFYPFTTAILDVFLLSTSVTTGCSLLLLLQQTMEYTFCIRLLASWPAPTVAVTLLKGLRYQRRCGELCFVMGVISFAISAGTLAYIKARVLTHKTVGIVCLIILGVAGCGMIWIMYTSEEKKKKADKKKNSWFLKSWEDKLKSAIPCLKKCPNAIPCLKKCLCIPCLKKCVNKCRSTPCLKTCERPDDYGERDSADPPTPSADPPTPSPFRDCASLADVVKENKDFRWAEKAIRELKVDGELINMLDNNDWGALDEIFATQPLENKTIAGVFERLKLLKFLKDKCFLDLKEWEMNV
eukprot:CAMPEP_0182490828 /NCGR_PEP_ID=MMETSP1321-20130603/543_1 /TAXON_ID=91990 /ORGANISM="Bolidomonas sp., Strain RCC1657" /LENGTH=396 /DNA_ID=CAMNT_0024693067 /DNA_START=97 /DNA_END=1283 /DNA_ORIENTATION=-